MKDLIYKDTKKSKIPGLKYFCTKVSSFRYLRIINDMGQILMNFSGSPILDWTKFYTYLNNSELKNIDWIKIDLENLTENEKTKLRNKIIMVRTTAREKYVRK